VHPDKVAGGTSEQIYIAGRIFDALNDAWATFQEQEKASDIYRMVFNVCVKQAKQQPPNKLRLQGS
jgi:singapore isolate B (sub-type 7) whole genome shotgun sequence assembly, scaffold_0